MTYSETICYSETGASARKILTPMLWEICSLKFGTELYVLTEPGPSKGFTLRSKLPRWSNRTLAP